MQSSLWNNLWSVAGLFDGTQLACHNVFVSRVYMLYSSTVIGIGLILLFIVLLLFYRCVIRDNKLFWILNLNLTEYEVKQLALSGQCSQPITILPDMLARHLKRTCKLSLLVCWNPCPQCPSAGDQQTTRRESPQPRRPGIRSTWTPHPGDTRRLWIPPNSHILPRSEHLEPASICPLTAPLPNPGT